MNLVWCAGKKITAEDNILKYFPQKTGCDISCKFSSRETNCMTCQGYFLGKRGKAVFR